MGLAFELHLPADKKFLLVGESPALTAKAIHPESEEAQELCQINHKEALDKAIKAGMVTPLNPLSYEQHTFPFGDALRRAVISLDDFKRFAETLQIEVVIWDEPLPTRDTDDVAGTKTHLTIREAASALAEKYGFNENTTNTMRTQLFEATERGDITVRHPHTLLPYTPNPRRDFYELVSVTDLNAWLEKQGAEYRLDNPEKKQLEPDSEEQFGAPMPTEGIDRNRVMAAFAIKANPDENNKFWDGKLSRPPKWLIDARINAGKPGTSALWNPLMLAHCLLAAGHMTRNQLDVVMNKRFPESADSWREQTEDKR